MTGPHPVLAVERAQRDVLPPLDVPRAPVVQEHDAEDVVRRVIHGDGLALPVGRPDYARLAAAEQDPMRCCREAGFCRCCRETILHVGVTSLLTGLTLLGSRCIIACWPLRTSTLVQSRSCRKGSPHVHCSALETLVGTAAEHVPLAVQHQHLAEELPMHRSSAHRSSRSYTDRSGGFNVREADLAPPRARNPAHEKAAAPAAIRSGSAPGREAAAPAARTRRSRTPARGRPPAGDACDRGNIDFASHACRGHEHSHRGGEVPSALAQCAPPIREAFVPQASPKQGAGIDRLTSVHPTRTARLLTWFYADRYGLCALCVNERQQQNGSP